MLTDLRRLQYGFFHFLKEGILRSSIQKIVCALGYSSCCFASFPDQILIIGDSFSDSGNQGAAILGLHTPNTNGTTWPVFLAEALGSRRLLPYTGGGTNYAYSKALTLSDYNPTLGYVPSMTTQAGYIPKGMNKQNPIFLFGGGNDYTSVLPDYVSPVDQPATNIVNIVESLHESHFEHLYVMNFLDVVNVPFPLLSTPPNSVVMASEALSFNQALQQQIGELDYSVFLVDTFSLFQSIGEKPSRYGFFNITEATPSMSSSSGYLWWYDGVHPTEAFHLILSDYMYALLEAPSCYVSLPELSLAVLSEQNASLRSQLYPATKSCNSQDWHAFLSGSYTPLLRPASSHSSNFHNSYGGDVLLGVERAIFSHWQLGMAGSYAYNVTSSSHGQVECSFDTASEAVSLFSESVFSKGYIQAIASIAFVQFYDIHRTFRTGSLHHHAKGKTHGLQGGGEVFGSYFIYAREHLSTGPLIDLTYQQAHVKGYQEKGSDIGNLKFKSITDQSMITGIGWELVWNANIRSVTMQSDVYLTFNRQWYQETKEVHYREASLPGNYGVWSVEIPASNFLGGGCQFSFCLSKHAALDFGYQLRVGTYSMSEHFLNVGFSSRF